MIGEVGLPIPAHLRKTVQIVRSQTGGPVESGGRGVAQPVETFEARSVAKMKARDSIGRFLSVDGAILKIPLQLAQRIRRGVSLRG